MGHYESEQQKMMTVIENAKKNKVQLLKSLALKNVRKFVTDQALKTASETVSSTKFAECGRQFQESISLLQEFIFSMVLPNDIDDVAAEILAGVEEALLYKKKQYVSTNVQNLQKFSLEVNFVIQFVTLICVENLRRLSLEDIPVRLRTDLLINLHKYVLV